METIEIPSIRLDREAFERIREALMVVLSLLSFWVMAAAETSHHYQYHYKFYPSLTFFVWVGVLSFVYTLGMAVGTRTGALGVELRRQLETAGPPVLAWLTYTAAIAASATSTDLHATFDESDGPVCKARHGAGKECEIPNFKGSSLGRFPLVSLIFGRAIISRNGLEAWMLFPERARAEHSR
ncbi:alpha-N-acetylglucosaminidase [Aureococcus anophagefferens]|uniref:Alpha-N-acetylglucosaminidase n=1 Tax=Aureococcus anophagefferens TaxID=44056 RepID=A0ABR1FW57_AURAN